MTSITRLLSFSFSLAISWGSPRTLGIFIWSSVLISTTVVESSVVMETVSVVGLLLPCLKIPVSRENTNSTTATIMMAATMPKAVMMRSNWVLTSSPSFFFLVWMRPSFLRGSLARFLS